MNTVNVGNALGELSLFSAALVLALGLWTGQRQLGFQGMWRVLGTLVATLLVSLLVYRWVFMGLVTAFDKGFSVGAFIAGIVSLALSFLPLLVAALQVGIIRDAGAHTTLH